MTSRHGNKREGREGKGREGKGREGEGRGGEGRGGREGGKFYHVPHVHTIILKMNAPLNIINIHTCVQSQYSIYTITYTVLGMSLKCVVRGRSHGRPRDRGKDDEAGVFLSQLS